MTSYQQLMYCPLEYWPEFLNFIYAVINKSLGNLYDALDGFGAAARSMKYRTAANAEMAEVAFLQKQWPAAEAYSFRSLDFLPVEKCKNEIRRLETKLERLYNFLQPVS